MRGRLRLGALGVQVDVGPAAVARFLSLVPLYAVSFNRRVGAADSSPGKWLSAALTAQWQATGGSAEDPLPLPLNPGLLFNADEVDEILGPLEIGCQGGQGGVALCNNQ